MTTTRETSEPKWTPDPKVLSALTRAGWTLERVLKFWATMGALYGRQWYSEHGPNPESWATELASMTPNEAALGWKACRASGDAYPCNVPTFVKRVNDALSAKRPIIPEYKPLPAPPRNVEAAMSKGTKAAAEKAESVDVQRLKDALGGKPVLATWPRRTILRDMVHPAGVLGTKDLESLRGQAREQGRSRWDLDLELMAYNGWTPDDEVNYEKALPGNMKTERDKGATPFLDMWRQKT